MGVYIKNMEIRENCMNCAARHGAECWLADCSYIPNYRKERPKWCPLIPVPPHGRLIDADWVRNDIDKKRPGRSYEDAWALTIIDAAPTVIEAEEGKT